MKGIPQRSISNNPRIENLNGLLDHIDLTHIAIRDRDFKSHYRICNAFVNRLLKNMKKVDPYFNMYCSRSQYAGSYYDNLRIKKADEFDVDIVLNLPVGNKHNNNDPKANDIHIEPQEAAFVQLKMGKQFAKLYKRDDWDITKTVYEWVDEDEDYLLSSFFIEWFEGVVDKALDKFRKSGRKGPPIFYLDNNNSYRVNRCREGPAVTLKITNPGINMSIDLVPALKFPEARWPISNAFRNIPAGCESAQGYWMVVPKRNKYASTDEYEERSWRLAMHDQERGLMYNKYNMKPTIRLMKMLRDSMNLPQISSYYVKTLFFWKSIRVKPRFWRRSPADLFKVMVKMLRDALENGEILYFWNPSENLIEHIEEKFLDDTVIRLDKLLNVLKDPKQYKSVARFLLTKRQFVEYEAQYL